MQEIERKKRKALFGTRAHSKILEAAVIESRKNWQQELEGLGNLGQKDLLIDQVVDKETKSFKERIIIKQDAKWKAIFDVFILFNVGYSCVTSMFYAAFS